MFHPQRSQNKLQSENQNPFRYRHHQLVIPTHTFEQIYFRFFLLRSERIVPKTPEDPKLRQLFSLFLHHLRILSEILWNSSEIFHYRTIQKHSLNDLTKIKRTPCGGQRTRLRGPQLYVSLSKLTSEFEMLCGGVFVPRRTAFRHHVLQNADVNSSTSRQISYHELTFTTRISTNV